MTLVSLVFLGLILSLAIILLSCELFTNGIEWLGKELKLGDGVVGSIFSAVGTCLPETMIPIIAILFGTAGENSVDIGVGAILGAPFMLSTLAFFVTGLSAIVFWNKRKTGSKMLVNSEILSRDIKFFIIVYSIGIIAGFVKIQALKYLISAGLIGLYIYYIMLTVSNDAASEGELDDLYLSKYLGLKTKLSSILLQVVIALAGIVFGAEIFVENIEIISTNFGISALILSLIITPIATELPEKFNSIIWVSKKKDTLALGNITGAMVFQSCIPVALGVAATSWNLDFMGIVSALLALASSLTVFISMKLSKKLTPFPLMAGGAFYLVFILVLVLR